MCHYQLLDCDQCVPVCTNVYQCVPMCASVQYVPLCTTPHNRVLDKKLSVNISGGAAGEILVFLNERKNIFSILNLFVLPTVNDCGSSAFTEEHLSFPNWSQIWRGSNSKRLWIFSFSEKIFYFKFLSNLGQLPTVNNCGEWNNGYWLPLVPVPTRIDFSLFLPLVPVLTRIFLLVFYFSPQTSTSTSIPKGSSFYWGFYESVVSSFFKIDLKSECLRINDWP